MFLPMLLNLGFSWHWVAFSWDLGISQSRPTSCETMSSVLGCSWWWSFNNWKLTTKEKAIKYMPYLLELQIQQVYYRPLTLLTSSLWTALLVRGFFFDEDAVCCSLSMALLRASELTGGSGWIVGTAPGTRSCCFFNPISFIKHLSKLSDQKWLPQMTEFSDGSEKFTLFTCTNLTHCRRKLGSFGSTLCPVLLEFPQNWMTQRLTIVMNEKKKVNTDQILTKLTSGLPCKGSL